MPESAVFLYRANPKAHQVSEEFLQLTLVGPLLLAYINQPFTYVCRPDFPNCQSIPTKQRRNHLVHRIKLFANSNRAIHTPNFTDVGMHHKLPFVGLTELLTLIPCFNQTRSRKPHQFDRFSIQADADRVDKEFVTNKKAAVLLMNSQALIGQYRAILAAAEQMLKFAKSNAWGNVSHTAIAIGGITQRLRDVKVAEILDESQLIERGTILARLVQIDGEIRQLREPWARTLDNVLEPNRGRRQKNPMSSLGLDLE